MNHNNHEHHQQLVDAVLQGDVSLAKKLIINHINDPLNMVIQKFQEHNIF